MTETEHATKADLRETEGRLHDEILAVETRVRERIDAVESRLDRRIDELRADVRDLRTETHRISFGLAALIVAMGVFT